MKEKVVFSSVKTKLNNYMATKKVVIEGSSDVTASQLAEFFKQVGNRALNGFHIQQFLDHKDPFGLDNLNDKRIWAEVYRLCGLDFSFHECDWNIKPGEWTIPVDVGMTPKKIIEAMQKFGVKFKLFCEDLNACIISDRESNLGPYLVNFKTGVKPDEEFDSMSANYLKEKSICGITLTERLLLEFAFYLLTGKHLDCSRMTLCSGSFYNFTGRNYVPLVYCEKGLVTVEVERPFESLCGAGTRKVLGIHLIKA